VNQSETDFEQFVCAACHNLRETLRGIRLHAEAAPDSRVEEQIRSMESLIDGMVEYSVAGVCESQQSRVEMDSVLKQALLHMDKRIRESAAVVTHDHLPAVMGNLDQLARIARQLIETPLSFTARRS